MALRRSERTLNGDDSTRPEDNSDPIYLSQENKKKAGKRMERGREKNKPSGLRIVPSERERVNKGSFLRPIDNRVVFKNMGLWTADGTMALPTGPVVVNSPARFRLVLFFAASISQLCHEMKGRERETGKKFFALWELSDDFREDGGRWSVFELFGSLIFPLF